MYGHRRACMTRLVCFCFAEAWKLQGFCLNFFNIFLARAQSVTAVTCRTITPLASYSPSYIWTFGSLGFLSFFVFPKCSGLHLLLMSLIG